jgi:hypothetical protein
MSNHFHLAVELTEPNLSKGMKWLQGTWIRRYNGFRQLIGRPFQGRYKALLVEPGESLGRVCHYIHLNPVRAGVVPAAEAARYAFSSLPKFVSGKPPEWLESAVLRGQAGELPDTKKGWKKYLEYLEYLAEDETSKKELISEKMSRGWCVGSPEFRMEMKASIKKRGAELERFAGLEPEEIIAEREQVWEERLQELAHLAKIDLSKMTAQKSDPNKVILATGLKLSTSVSNGWLTKRLDMGEAASASQFVRRYLQSNGNKGEVEKLLSRVKT